MMPECYHKGCKKVAEVHFGNIDTGEKDAYGKAWTVTVFLCKKHYKKMLKRLGLRYHGGKE